MTYTETEVRALLTFEENKALDEVKASVASFFRDRPYETAYAWQRTVEWSPTLRKIIDSACERSPCEYVFVTHRGLPWGEWALQSAMRRFKPGFRFRDLRPKARSDSDHGILSHAPGMDGVYKRRSRVRPVK
ncbi:MAG: hypothetical protein WEE89_07185 [Gemmatimonadota bacterium]